jgi:uncharacterized protein (TIGR02996 family)
MRTFQHSDGQSYKFWHIEVKGSSFTITYGKIGVAGQALTKDFADADTAQTEAEVLIREKLSKGYIETTPKPPSSKEEAFERALADDPNDLATAGVYGDYLAEKGDPRGEFMLVQIALEDESRSPADRSELKKREASLLKKHEKEWLGPLAAVTVDAKLPPSVGHRFARGWLSRLEFHHLTVAQARALAQSPQARLLRELVVERLEYEAPVGTKQQYVHSYFEPGPDVPSDLDEFGAPGVHALCRCPQLTVVRSFQFGELLAEGEEQETYFNCHTSGELAHHLVQLMPNLEELYLLARRVDANKLFILPLLRLRVLQLYHSDSYPLDKLAANPSLTNLTTLRCHPHALEFSDSGEGAYIRLPHLQAICRSPHMNAVTHLQLRLTNFGDDGAKEIVESGILKRLKVLDLHGGCITDEGARRLADCPDLKHLDYLDLSRNAMTKAGEQAITATGVKCVVGFQHGGAPEEYLYEGDME